MYPQIILTRDMQSPLVHKSLRTTTRKSIIQFAKIKNSQVHLSNNFKVDIEQQQQKLYEEVYQLSEASATSVQQNPNFVSQQGVIGGIIAAGVLFAALGIKKIFDTPSRTYDENVGDEYDAWTQEGILEYYWGEHIHLGYYDTHERDDWKWKKNFKQAKYDFMDKMLDWSDAQSPKRILDVGCGFGGTSRYLAQTFPDAHVTGITLSPKQVQRGMEIAKERGITNIELRVMDALNMEFQNEEFDFVWACESGEHMPDKKKYIDEMTRVLKAEGNMVIACWCQRNETPDNLLTDEDRKNLQFLYEEWAHPYFISINDFCQLMEGTGQMENVDSDDWTAQTLPSWRQSVWVGVVDPWYWLSKGPRLWYKCSRDAVTLERMHRAFRRGLMQYGMMKGVKKAVVGHASQKAMSASQPQTIRL